MDYRVPYCTLRCGLGLLGPLAHRPAALAPSLKCRHAIPMRKWTVRPDFDFAIYYLSRLSSQSSKGTVLHRTVLCGRSTEYIIEPSRSSVLPVDRRCQHVSHLSHVAALGDPIPAIKTRQIGQSNGRQEKKKRPCNAPDDGMTGSSLTVSCGE